jgi:glycosyltransferase involved in cell wall biosynthesis
MPKVSVILTSYNHAEFIKDAIESVLNQTFIDYELIIWDDSSSDNSWEIIKSYKDPRIKAFRNEQNMIGKYINKALEVASGKYIAVHHSDDVWETEKLKKQVAFLDANPKYGAVFTLAEIIDHKGARLTDNGNFFCTIFNQENRSRYRWLNYFFYNYNCLCHPSVLIRKECYKTVGYYDKRYAQLPDLDLWIRLCMRYDIHILQEKLVKYRVLKDEANASGRRPESHRRTKYEFIKILRNYLNIRSKDEILKIFPEVVSIVNEKYLSDPDMIRYAVAQLALKSPHNTHRIFAKNTLYDLLGQQRTEEKLERFAGYTYRDLIVLTGGSESGVLEAEIKDKDTHIRNLDAIIADKNRQISNLETAVREKDVHIRNLEAIIKNNNL